MSDPKILIADDSVTIQKVFELAFENEGVELVGARNGDDAYDLIQSEKPHLVIADVNMPGVSGFDLCARLRNEPATFGLPVFLLVSKLDDFDTERAAAVGANGKFEKPFKSEEMVAQVMEAVRNLHIVENLDEITDEELDDNEEGFPASGDDEFTDEFDVNAGDDDIFDDVDETDDLSDDDAASSITIGEDDGDDIFESTAVDSPVEAEDHDEYEDTGQFGDTTVAALSVDEAGQIEVSVVRKDIQTQVGGVVVEDDENKVDFSVTIDEGSEEELDYDDDEEDEEEDDDLEEPDWVAHSVESAEDRMLRALEDDAAGHELDILDDFDEDENNEQPTDDDPDDDENEDTSHGVLIDEEMLMVLVEEKTKEAVAEALTEVRIKEAMEAVARETIESMKPQIIEAVKNIAKKITLAVAEKMVKETLQQIKPDRK